MLLTLVEITGPDDVKTPELIKLARDNRFTKPRRQFIAHDSAENEVGFLYFDPPSEDYLVLYYLWVVEARRGEGIGTKLIDMTIRDARDRGFKRLLVRPAQIADGWSEERLVKWYRGQGFEDWAEDKEVLQRIV